LNKNTVLNGYCSPQHKKVVIQNYKQRVFEKIKAKGANNSVMYLVNL